MQRLLDISDDEHHKQTKRSQKRVTRRMEDLATAEIPDRSCVTCMVWRHGEDMWGECRDAIVVRQRVTAEQYPDTGLEVGMVIARGEPAWWAAMAFGKATPMQTHRTFRACSRYDRHGGESPVVRRGPSLLERVRQAS